MPSDARQAERELSMKTAKGHSWEFFWGLRSTKRLRGRRIAFTWRALLGGLAVAALSLFLAGCPGGITLSAGVPVIASVTPSSIAAGGPAQTITITGTGFISAVPLANGTALAITSLSSTQIVATIPASLIASPGSIVIVVTNLLPSGNLTSIAATITVSNTTGNAPELAISKSHTGNFTQGQTDATYTVALSNVGTAPTSGTITVTEMPPVTALTITDMSGTGWTCSVTSFSCTRSDALPSYPIITVTVNVATNAPATAMNVVSVSGGGSAGSTASDPTTITPSGGNAQLAVSIMSNPSTFTQGGTGIYAVTIANVSSSTATSGTIAVVVNLAPSETPANISGSGATCQLTSLSCTFSGPLAPGATFMIMVDFAVAPTAPSSVIVSVQASGGGSPSVTGMQTTQVNP
jgi:hypothetical protein